MRIAAAWRARILHCGDATSPVMARRPRTSAAAEPSQPQEAGADLLRGCERHRHNKPHEPTTGLTGMNRPAALAALCTVATLGWTAPTGAQPVTPINVLATLDVTVPSESGGETGIAVRVQLPRTPRFVHGAPVVVLVAGGFTDDAYSLRDVPVTDAVLVTFAFPGGVLDQRRSGGTSDLRGPAGLLAFADVVEYALGRRPDTDGHRIGDRAPYPVLTSNVGVAGWSNGGTTTLIGLASQPDKTRGIAWVALYESPAFDSAIVSDIAAARDGGIVPATYVPGSCTLLACDVAFPAVRWDPTATEPRRAHDPGALYADRNGNRRFDASSEAVLQSLTHPQTGQRVFSTGAVVAARKSRSFGSAWPASIADADTTVAFWAWRDIRGHVHDLVSNHPGLAVIIFASVEDHVQTDPEHPHIALLYNSLRGGVRFVRVNADRAYAGPASPDIDANAAWPTSIDAWLSPEGQGDTLSMAAAVRELADRVQFAKWDANLTAAIAR